MKRLVLWDGSTTTWLEHATPGEWHVAVVGASDVLLQRRHAAALAKLGDLRFVDLAPHAASAREAVAAYLTDALAALPRDDLGELWWALELVEKSPFRGKLVERLYRLALVARVQQAHAYGEVILAIGDPLLVAVATGVATQEPRLDPVRYWSNALLEVRSALAARVVALAGWPRAAGRVVCFTFYPYWWLRPFESDAAERFLDVRPPTFSYAAWLSAPRTLLRRRDAARVARSRAIVPLQREATVGAILRLLSPRLFLCARRAAARRRAVAAFEGTDIEGLIADELVRSLSATQFFAWQLVRHAVSRHVRRAAPAALLYRVEYQPFEHALLLGAHGTRTVGFRHSPFGASYIPMRFAAGALARTDMPLPDAMLVSGPAGAAALVAQGYPGPVAVCGPQRHGALVAALARRGGRTRRPDQFLAYIAIAIVPADTEALLVAVAHATRELPGFRLVLKTHPSREMPDAMLRDLAVNVGLGGRFTLAGPDFHAGLKASDVAVLVGSTLAFEAIALDVPTIVFENPATYAATSLADYEAGFHVVHDGAELARALTDVRDDGPATRAKRDRWPDLLRSVFGDLDAPVDSLLIDSLRAVGVEGGAP